MWITLTIKDDAGEDLVFSSCQPQDEEAFPLPPRITTRELIQLVSDKTGLDASAILQKRTVKVNLKVADFQTFIIEPMEEGPLNPQDGFRFHAGPQGGSQTGTQGEFQSNFQSDFQLGTQGDSQACPQGNNQAYPQNNFVGLESLQRAVVTNPEDPNYLVHQILLAQQQQIMQNQQLLQAIVGLSRNQEAPRFRMVKPDPFDGHTTNSEAWLSFYEYASEKNGWRSDDDKVKNLRLFLTGMAKKWYELHLTDHLNDPWEQWKRSFHSAFQENPVEKWDKAIFYKYKAGSVMEYFYEKRRLLQMADYSLPDTSVVPLVIHGLPKELQKQVQVKAPKTVEGLLDCFQHLCLDAWPRAAQKPAEATLQSHRYGSLGQKPSHWNPQAVAQKQSATHLATFEDREMAEVQTTTKN